jgi:hypothetical protein
MKEIMKHILLILPLIKLKILSKIAAGVNRVYSPSGKTAPAAESKSHFLFADPQQTVQ